MARLTYLGHAAFMLELDGKRILIDPWLSNPLSPMKPEEAKDVDLVIVTHGHFDHIGDAPKILANNPRAKVVAVYELASHVAKQAGIGDDRVVGGNIGGPMKVDGLDIALTPATHSSSGIGVATGVVVRGEEATVYHAGDTGVFMDMRIIGEIYKPHVALLPIGGHFTMDPVEAAKAVELLRPRVAIPMHYGTFPILYGKPEDFEKLVDSKCLPTEVKVLKPGESYEFSFKR
ncbi:MAG: metal-dependent hydrolase [Desulfurococcales archaeon]|nr:metal-dependent hydrolase [Desulfurococcales archaeon]